MKGLAWKRRKALPNSKGGFGEEDEGNACSLKGLAVGSDGVSMWCFLFSILSGGAGH